MTEAVEPQEVRIQSSNLQDVSCLVPVKGLRALVCLGRDFAEAHAEPGECLKTIRSR